MKKLILEARINEYAMRDDNAHVPWTSDEIAESAARCREAGASIVHFHARGPDGRPAHTIEIYAEIIRKIRSKCDALIHPTLGWFSNDGNPAARIDCVTTLARDPATKPDFAPIDTGSINLDLYENGRFSEAGRVYMNRTDTLIDYARAFKVSGIKPILVTWSIGFTRRAARRPGWRRTYKSCRQIAGSNGAATWSVATCSNLVGCRPSGAGISPLASATTPTRSWAAQPTR